MIKKTKLIDLMGLRCPIPVLKIAKKIKEIRKGDIIKVKVDDPKAENDINELNKQINITIIKKIKHNDFMLFEIEKN
jgi:TusA-related sulfurtransferase|tara:strand:- start:532 stop:762 length:231 start_codon:yes stop_codon:yes gene_type:complete